MRGIADGWARGARRRLMAGALAMTLVLLGTLCALAASPALALVSEFGNEGEGAGEFAGPIGVAVNSESGSAESGSVYLADTENNRVEQFGAAGEFVRTWGFGVSDATSPSFQVCEAPGPCFAGLRGGGGGQFAEPTGVAVDNSAGLAQGDVYVVDPFNERVERFGPEGKFILTFGAKVNKSAQEKGEIASEDICPVNPGDQCQAGTRGTGPGEFKSVGHTAIAVGPTGTVYVAEAGRIQKFSSSGSFEGQIPLPEEAGRVEGLIVDSSSDLYVLRESHDGVRKYDGAGKEVGEARDPAVGGPRPSIALGKEDQLIVSDPAKGHVLAYGEDGAQLSSMPEESDASGGIALNPSSGSLYVIHSRPQRVSISTLPPPGPLVLEGSEAASDVLPTSATLNAGINPEGPEETHYNFEYGTSALYGTSVPVPEGELSPGFEDQQVSAAIANLQANTTYHFRVVVSDALGQSTEGPDQTFTTLPPVSINSESVSSLTATSAKLSAELNPHGLASEYHFEYGLSSAYEKSAPVPDGEVGEGNVDEVFSVIIQNLLPGHAYHYRVVAHNALGVVVGSDRTFITQGGEAPGLADDRAWEMVSPAQKHGVSLEAIPPEGGVIEAAPGGGGLAYIAVGPIDEDPAGSRSALDSQLLATRTAAGVWQTEDITTPHQAPVGLVPGQPSEYKLFSRDLSRAAVEPEGATPLSPQTTERTPYRREANGSFTPLVTAENVPAGTKFGGEEGKPELFAGGVFFVTGTPDLSQMLLDSPSSLVQDFETKGLRSVYEWDEGQLKPVSVLPSEAPAAEEGDASVGNQDTQVRNAISEDGQRAFFTTTTSGRLYARDLARKETVRVDAAAPGVKEAGGGARFQFASADGSKVFFTDANRLTKDATAKANGPDLYECAISAGESGLSCALKDLSVDLIPGQAADVQGAMIGADEGGRYAYFVARGALESGASDGACPEVEEACLNLYVYDTVSDTRRLVAVLSEGDAPDWFASDNSGELSKVTSRVSPNGLYLAFMSERSLTGYDNRDAHSGIRDEEVYVYDYAANTLSCASCEPTGQRPQGAFDQGVFPGLLVDRPLLWKERWLAGSIPGWTGVGGGHALHQSRYLSDSGRLFFNSPASLVGADSNGTQDVYEYEPSGVGNCTSAPACLSLISSGTSSEETTFLEASESGDDVFFLTAAQLSSTDQDQALDVYDAHVCSVAPGCAPASSGSPPPCVSADACRSAPTPQPGIFGAPASSTFSGSGNLTPASPPTPKAKQPTRSQRLAKALKACKKKPKRARAQCQRAARKRFGRAHHAKHGKGKSGKSRARKGAKR